jgi:hypothetical protein
LSNQNTSSAHRRGNRSSNHSTHPTSSGPQSNRLITFIQSSHLVLSTKQPTINIIPPGVFVLSSATTVETQKAPPHHKNTVLNLPSPFLPSKKVCPPFGKSLQQELKSDKGQPQNHFPEKLLQSAHGEASPTNHSGCASTSESTSAAATTAGEQCANSAHVNTEPASRAAVSSSHTTTTSTRSTRDATSAKRSK